MNQTFYIMKYTNKQLTPLVTNIISNLPPQRSALYIIHYTLYIIHHTLNFLHYTIYQQPAPLLTTMISNLLLQRSASLWSPSNLHWTGQHYAFPPCYHRDSVSTMDHPIVWPIVWNHSRPRTPITKSLRSNSPGMFLIWQCLIVYPGTFQCPSPKI